MALKMCIVSIRKESRLDRSKTVGPITEESAMPAKLSALRHKLGQQARPYGWPLVTVFRRAGCGKSASPVRRGGNETRGLVFYEVNPCYSFLYSTGLSICMNPW